MSERIPLQNDGVISLRRIGGTDQEEFTIRGVQGKGASVICYLAENARMGRGILKELYPLRCVPVLKRDESGQLIASGDFDAGYQDDFLEEKERFLKPYSLLLRCKLNCSDDELFSFLPVFELYEAGTGNGSVYVWTPEPAVKTFDRYLNETINPDCREIPEGMLRTVLSVVKRLTECIGRLHRDGLIHRDIKPENFGFRMREGEPIVESLVLTDFDTISDIFEEDQKAVGTNGYREPDAGKVPFEQCTDIYSVGATLFSSVVLRRDPPIPGLPYDDSYYCDLEKMVSESALIQSSPRNAGFEIRKKLSHILRRSLAPKRSARYERCEEMLADLDDLLKTWDGLQADERLVEAEKKAAEKCSQFDMLYHFYKYPLYKDVMRDNSNELRVMLLGFNGYSWKYLDALLQMGQMTGRKLVVTIAHADSGMFREYLNARPMFRDFFGTDYDFFERQEPAVYGHIFFREAELFTERSGMKAVNQQEIRNLLREIRPHRVFISLANDAMNVTAARYCDGVRSKVFYASNGDYPEDASQHYVPLYVRRKGKDAPEYADLERMAFNAHLLWEKDWFSVNDEEIKKFRKNMYLSGSSISNVLSVKYKLFLAGIDLDKPGMTPFKAAELFERKLKEKTVIGQEIYVGEMDENGFVADDGTGGFNGTGILLRDYLIWSEHRRWVTEKICDGWSLLTDLSQCPIGDTKDKAKHHHTCMVHSRPDSRLLEMVTKNPAKWEKENMTDEEYNSLDPLDRLSVDLHRKYVDMADHVSPTALLKESVIERIREQVKGNPKAELAFQEWLECVKNILKGESQRVRQYNRLSRAMANAYSASESNQVTSLLDEFNKDGFNYKLEACRYLIIKNNDVALIENIPFILTYDVRQVLMIPLVTGGFSTVFENVAAATVINPRQIHYLYAAEDRNALRTLFDTLPRIARYAEKKGLRATFSLTLFLGGSLAEEKSEVTSSLVETGGELLRNWQIRCLPLENKKPLSQRIRELTLKAGEKQPVALQAFGTAYNGLSGVLRGGGVYDGLPHFTFDSGSQTFTEISYDCPVKYVSQKMSLSVGDMMAFGLTISRGDQPEFFDRYERLWTLYRNNSESWKALMKMLKEYHEKNEMKIDFPMQKKADMERRSYSMGEGYYRTVKPVVDKLKEYGVIGADSRVECPSGLCEITVYDPYNNKDSFDSLFSDFFRGTKSMDDISIVPESGKFGMTVTMKTDVLSVRSFAYTKDKINGEKFFQAYDKILEQLAMMKIISALSRVDGISFEYTSRNCKRLMTSEGRMLEIFVYHRLREQAEFDDVMSGCSVHRGDGPYSTTNELDCVVTKGFRSVIIECKATTLDSDYYYKLDSLARELGVNTIPVIITDLRKRYHNYRPDDKIERGNKLNIHTVIETAEVEDIGRTILRLFESEET